MRNLSVRESPAHVMTRVDTDQLHVTNNGDTRTDSVMEIASLGTGVERRVNIGRGNPHVHWMSANGQQMVTPNVTTGDTTQYNFGANMIESILPTSSSLSHPIATGMMPDVSKYCVANLLGSTMTVIDMHSNAVIKTIDMIADYQPVTGVISGPVGALPIQTPVGPNGKNMVTTHTLTGTITIVDTRPGLPTTDTVVAMLGCDPGCHGVQCVGKQAGGYYAYVSSKFFNTTTQDTAIGQIASNGPTKRSDPIARTGPAGEAIDQTRSVRLPYYEYYNDCLSLSAMGSRRIRRDNAVARRRSSLIRGKLSSNSPCKISY